jgi:hypothetical protein
MKRYSEERKQEMLKKMAPPGNIPIAQLVEETGISDCTLYTWRKEARIKGIVVPGDGKNSEKWSSADKFAVVIEVAGLNEAELGEYCRKKGLYLDQIAHGKQACMGANATQQEQTKAERDRTKQDQKKIKKLEKELNRKEKALAEAAALLILQKKVQDLWGESEDE